MNKKIKTTGLIITIIILYYGLQYASTAVHYNCEVIKDDCVPPIYGASELFYRSIVQPPWLDQFKIDPITLSFKDGRFIFWEGEVEGKMIVFRLGENDSPVMYWIEQKLPVPANIRPASGDNISRWLLDNPKKELM